MRISYACSRKNRLAGTGGVAGAVDQAAEAAQLSKEIQSGTQTTREPVYSQTANSYGVNDLGDTYIEVDLSEQHMYYYQNGADIFVYVAKYLSAPCRKTFEIGFDLILLWWWQNFQLFFFWCTNLNHNKEFTIFELSIYLPLSKTILLIFYFLP